MSENAVKLDLNRFSTFQKELHRRRGKLVDNGGVEMSEGVNTIFKHHFRKISWYTPIKERLAASDNQDETIYTASNTYDHLLKTFLDTVLPSLRIKSSYADKYRMCWTHNVGINISKGAKLLANDVPLNGFDSIGHDILSQYGYLTKPGFKKHHLISIGSVPTLEKWSVVLPAHPINVLQPFYYAKSNHLALPLLNSSITQFKHVYKLRKKILDLLRMQKYDTKTGNWVDIKPTYSVIEGIKDKDATIPRPELWGRYAKITDEEREWYRDCALTHEYFYDDLVSCDDTNRKTYGQVAEIPLVSATPVKAVFWVNENLNATSRHNYSNYTTNADNAYLGWNPSKMFTLNYSTSTRVESMSIDHAEREEAWQFPRAPWEPGYNVITFCNDPFSIDGESSVDLNNHNAKLHITLGNTDPSLITPEDYEPKIDNLDDEVIEEDVESVTDTDTKNSKKIPGANVNFMVKCRMLVYRKLTFSFDKSKGGYLFQRDSLDTQQIYFDDKKAKQ